MIIKLKNLQNYLENKNAILEENSREPTDIPQISKEPTDIPQTSKEPTDIPQTLKEPTDIPQTSKEPTDTPQASKEPNITLEEIRNIAIWEVVADLGNRFLEAGNKEIAKECYVQALELGSTECWIHIKLSDLVDYDESVALLEKSWEISKNEWYFLVIKKSEEKIKEIENLIEEAKERFNYINPQRITNPYIFLSYLEKCKDKENIKEEINYFLNSLKKEYEGLEVVENIKNFYDCNNNGIYPSSFEEPDASDNNDEREEKLRKLKELLKFKS